jgi:hypothetical protein
MHVLCMVFGIIRASGEQLPLLLLHPQPSQTWISCQTVDMVDLAQRILNGESVDRVDSKVPFDSGVSTVPSQQMSSEMFSGSVSPLSPVGLLPLLLRCSGPRWFAFVGLLG